MAEVRIAHGSKAKQCPIHKLFRVIVITEISRTAQLSWAAVKPFSIFFTGSKYGPLIWALTLVFFICVGLQVWALIGIWYIVRMWIPNLGPILKTHGFGRSKLPQYGSIANNTCSLIPWTQTNELCSGANSPQMNRTRYFGLRNR